MDFLPADYEAPKGASGYMKLQDGENKFRIMSKPIVGWEDWDNKRPIRFTMGNKPKASIDPNKPIKHFWAFIVYNYGEAKVQILQITQARIRNAIEALVKDDDWGHPASYDLKIVKKGEGTKTEYSVNPLPHKKVSAELIKAFNDKPIYLEALFSNQDPFAEYGTVTPGVFEVPSVHDTPTKANPEPFINDKEVKFLESSLERCSLEYQGTVADKLKNKYKVAHIRELKPAAFVALQADVLKNQIPEECPF